MAASALLVVCLLALLSLLSLPSVQAQSFCDKYSMALFNSTDAETETKLITAVVTRAVLGDTDVRPPVEGLVGRRSPILRVGANALTPPSPAPRPALPLTSSVLCSAVFAQFFNGSFNYRHSGEPPAPDYLTDKTALASLAAHFVSFLGDSLGCSGAGFNKTGYRKDQAYVHELMRIDQREMDYFNAQFALTLLSFGVAVADLETTVVPFLGLFQRGAGDMREICTAKDCWPVNMPVAPTELSFCEKYSVALFGNATERAELSLVTAVVTTTVLGTTDSQHGVMVKGLADASSPLLAILNGSVPYRQDGSTPPDYLSNTRELARLATKFVEFFGSALGCNSYPFPAYRPTGNHTQHYFHAKMGINKEKMLYFDTAVATTLIYYGVPSDGPDIKAAAALLAMFNKGAGDNEICTEDDCPTVGLRFARARQWDHLVKAIQA